MLSLDDPAWSKLTHAYGSASDIPALLRQLADAPRAHEGSESEPWFSLWSSLCHQGDVFDASYAAVPHIIEIASEVHQPIDFGFFQLPAAIEISRNNGKGPPVPLSLADAYQRAFARLPECVAIHRNESWDQATLLSIASALAVSKGHHRIAEAILNLDDHLIAKLIELDFE